MTCLYTTLLHSLTNEDLSVGVPKDIEVVSVSICVAILHDATDLSLSISSDVTLCV